MLIVALLLQAAAPAVPAAHSILVPVGDQPCVRKSSDNEVVVCADPLPAQALPLPDEAVSPGPRPVNRDMTGIGALRAEGAPCGATTLGCTTGVNVFGMATALVRGVQKVIAPGSCCEEPDEGTDHFRLAGDIINGVGKAGKRKPEKTKRVAIDLDEPVLAGRVHP